MLCRPVRPRCLVRAVLASCMRFLPPRSRLTHSLFSLTIRSPALTPSVSGIAANPFGQIRMWGYPIL